MDIIKSKKFQTALLAAVTAGVASYTGLSIEQTGAIITPFVAYIIAQGWVDGMRPQ